MPIFEYRCGECGHQFEALIRSTESAACPECRSSQSEKLLSAPAAHVRGGNSLPVTTACPPPDAALCGPGCCRLP